MNKNKSALTRQQRWLLFELEVIYFWLRILYRISKKHRPFRMKRYPEGTVYELGELLHAGSLTGPVIKYLGNNWWIQV